MLETQQKKPKTLADLSRERMASRGKQANTCLTKADSAKQKVYNHMRELFLRGQYSIAEVAKAVGVSYATARSMIDKDDNLREIWETELQARVDGVERSMFELATEGNNEIAKEKAQEYILKSHRRQTYGENVVSQDALKSLPKIIIAPIVSRSPIQPEAIEVKSE